MSTTWDLFNQRIGRMDDGSFLGMIESLSKLESLNPEVVVPGHGQTGDISMVNQTKRLHILFYGSVESQYEEGLADFEMKPKVVDELRDYSEWGGFDEGIGRWVSIGYLEVEENNF